MPGRAERELQVACRTSQLAGVMMDDRITTMELPGATDLANLKRIAAADQDEVQWARRTLHRWVWWVGCGWWGWRLKRKPLHARIT